MDNLKKYLSYITEVLAVIGSGWLLVSLPWVLWVAGSCGGMISVPGSRLCALEGIILVVFDVLLAAGLGEWLMRRYRSGKGFTSHWAITALAVVTAVIVVWYYLVILTLHHEGPSNHGRF